MLRHVIALFSKQLTIDTLRPNSDVVSTDLRQLLQILLSMQKTVVSISIYG
jgi:hypothetical protein